MSNATDRRIALANAAQLALGLDAPINGGGDARICAHGIGQCYAPGTPGHEPCPVCEHRALHYPGTGPCDAHNGDVWAGAR